MSSAGDVRSRRARNAPALVSSSLNFRRFVVVGSLGALGGLLIPSFGPLRQPLLVIAFVALSATLFRAIGRRQFTFAWGLTAFLCALEPGFRAHAPVLPYLALDYVLLASGTLSFMLARPRRRAPMLPAIAYGAYLAFELGGVSLANSFSGARGIVLPSALMLIFVVNAARTRLTPAATTFVMASYVTGAVALTGFALRSYLAGKILWGTESNSEAVGGMPPNHISVLFAVAVFACVLLSEAARGIQRIVFLSVAILFGSLMVLTFSRGGTVLVVGALVLYYLILRPRSMRTIFALLAIGLIGVVIAYSTAEITGGKIVERYSQTNTSNRFTIAVQGWDIYLDHPVIGVGTSNFSEALSETEFGHASGAHNELIRAAAEHGTLGLLTWALFIVSAFVEAARRGEAHRGRRGLRVVIVLFATTSMFYNGLKLTVQPMLLLLSLAAFTAVETPRTSITPRKAVDSN